MSHVHICTFEGLTHWTRNMFEKLGYVILAASRGDDYLVADYIRTLSELSVALNDKIKSIKDDDKREDLHTLSDHVNVLTEHVRKEFGSVNKKNNKVNKSIAHMNVGHKNKNVVNVGNVGNKNKNVENVGNVGNKNKNVENVGNTGNKNKNVANNVENVSNVEEEQIGGVAGKRGRTRIIKIQKPKN